jgi:hypothetical protein
MEPSEIDETTETADADPWDMNFIVTHDGDVIYDLATGIQYQINHIDNAGRTAAQVHIHRIGAEYTRFAPLYEGDDAVAFWTQLRARVFWGS